ncbi:hypothetical protein ACFQ5N_10200 [Lutibacter holmesii]|uniref:Uncharacterized protein n=1 Tax=Lutibacter holmesii TaxID=1137985 RepID=A0ABW3WQK8_9FLAO
MHLQPLRIEASWEVTYNQLYEVDPIAGNEPYFEGSSLLMLQNNTRLKLIDVQWRPEQDLQGAYQLQVLNFVEIFNSKTNEFDIEPNWEHPFLTFSTKSRLKLVAELEELMRTLPCFQDPRMTINRGVVDEISEAYRLQLLENGISNELVEKVIANGQANIQNYIVDQQAVTREIIAKFAENGISKKVRNIAQQKLNSKQFKV